MKGDRTGRIDGGGDRGCQSLSLRSHRQCLDTLDTVTASSPVLSDIRIGNFSLSTEF